MKSALKLKAGKKTEQSPSKRQQAAAETLRQRDALQDQDALLDEALDETFPASDPVSLTQPSRRRRAVLKPRNGRRI